MKPQEREIEFQGNTYNLSQMGPFMQDKDREDAIRHNAVRFFAGVESGSRPDLDDDGQDTP